eukprot:11652647-Ditylum_brightwellii.AAC.1
MHDYSYNTLGPDWNLIAQTAITLCQYVKRLSINHIKSHQDDDTPEEKLDLPYRLNSPADQIAMQYRIQYGKLCVQVPRVAVNTVQVNTPSGVVAGHYMKRLRDIATTPALRSYLQEKHSWSDETFESIDWKTYQQ